MKSQSRPFVVEIKRAKRSPLPVEGDGQPRGLKPTAPGWGELAEEASRRAAGSPARQAAEALFAQAMTAPAPEAREPADAGSPAWGAAGHERPAARRVLFAVDPSTAADAVVDSVGGSEAAAHEPERASTVSAPRKPRAPRVRVAQVPLEASPIEPARLPAAQLDAGLQAPAQAQRERRPAIRLRGDELPLGQRWKRRLPKFCR